MKWLLLTVIFLAESFGCESIWNNGPTQLMQDICNITEIENLDDLASVTKQTNFRWIRPKGLERWDMYSILLDSQRTKLTKIIKNSALAKTKMPIKKHYDAVVIMGATTPRVAARISFLLKLAKTGVTWDKVFLLGSTRDLNTGPEQDQKMAKFLKYKGANETEMAAMEYLWSQLNKPEFCKDIKAISIQSGRRADGTRANTEDTLIELVKVMGDLKGQSILFISNNPYICYQDAVVKRVLKHNNVNVETVGDAMGDNESMENVLDAIARCLTNMN